MIPTPPTPGLPEALAGVSTAADDRARRAALGQFLTLEPVADLLASFFASMPKQVDLLDPGAGAGALTLAYVRRACSSAKRPARINATAYEIDPHVLPRLMATMTQCRKLCRDAGIEFDFDIVNQDFIEAASTMARGDLFASEVRRFNTAILNPPYLKINSDSKTRHLLRSAGIETSNLYTAFVALASRLLVRGSELVAITPRSFCNGPYFRPFREDFLGSMSLRRLHVFDSRSSAFKGDQVLQENIIFHAVKGQPQSARITLSSSSGEPGAPVRKKTASATDIVHPSDPERFIHLPVEAGSNEAKARMAALPCSLADLPLQVSTGRVVDFRVKPHLRKEPESGAVPLLYPCHFEKGGIHWPRSPSRKPNALARNPETESSLVPAGIYVLVKRFSSKEERRRVVACVLDPRGLPAGPIGIENHLNYYHLDGQGMSPDLARGLCAFLNSSLVDVYFRQFSGHTQVNATDLRSLRYPDRKALERLGKRVKGPAMNQEQLDEALMETCFNG